jgi:hypothetical protein
MRTGCLRKANQPSLRTQLAKLPWREVEVPHCSAERGRRELRTLKVVTITTGITFPHPTQSSRSPARLAP